MKFHRFIALGLTVFGSQIAYADSPESAATWQAYDYYVSFSGNAVKKKARHQRFLTETLYTDQYDDVGNVAFTCINELLTVSVAYKPIDMKDFIKNHRTSRRWKTRRAEIEIDGKLQKMNDWTYLPKYGIVISRKRSDGAKIYNAAIRGQTVTMDFDFKKPIELILPKPNIDFAEFGGPCGMGKYKNKQKGSIEKNMKLKEDVESRIQE